jgi:hypothetical protein
VDATLEIRTVRRIAGIADPSQSATVTLVGRTLYRSIIASVLVLGLVTGVMDLATLSVTAATKPKTVPPCAPHQLRAIPLGVLAQNGTSGYLVALKNVQL